MRTYEKFRSEGLTVAGIDVDGDTSSLPPFIRQFGVPYAILLPSPGSPLMDQIESLPTSLLVDQDGGVARTYIGAISEDTLATAVAALLKERRSDLLPHPRPLGNNAADWIPPA